MFYDQIHKNQMKSIFIIFCAFWITEISLTTIIFSFTHSYVISALIGVFIFLGYLTVSIWGASSLVLSLNHARKLENDREYPEYWHICEDLALISQIPMPTVYVIDDPMPNAFAVGISTKQCAVAATTGILSSLNREELEAVMAHEFSHIRHRDTLLMTLIMALSSALLLVWQFRYFAFYSGRRDNNDNKNGNSYYYFILILLSILAPILIKILQLSLSRKREYMADAGSVELCRNPQALISALKIISRSAPSKVADKNSAAMYFTNPFKKNGDSWFSTHPSIENRIKALERM